MGLLSGLQLNAYYGTGVVRETKTSLGSINGGRMCPNSRRGINRPFLRTRPTVVARLFRHIKNLPRSDRRSPKGSPLGGAYRYVRDEKTSLLCLGWS